MSTHAYIESERVRESLRRSRAADGRRPSGAAELWVGGGFLLAATALAVLAGTPTGVSLATGGAVRARRGGRRARAVRHRRRASRCRRRRCSCRCCSRCPSRSCRCWSRWRSRWGWLPAILAGRVPASRMLTVPGNSWFAWGPAFVLLLAHDHSPPPGRWCILLLALAAQFACDFAANAVRERLRGGISVCESSREEVPAGLPDRPRARAARAGGRAAPRSHIPVGGAADRAAVRACCGGSPRSATRAWSS